jgi:hypothetical protein
VSAFHAKFLVQIEAKNLDEAAEIVAVIEGDVVEMNSSVRSAICTRIAPEEGYDFIDEERRTRARHAAADYAAMREDRDGWPATGGD